MDCKSEVYFGFVWNFNKDFRLSDLTRNNIDIYNKKKYNNLTIRQPTHDTSMNICLNNLYLSVCVTQFFVSIRMARFVQGKWFQNLYGLYVSITRSCISANGSSEWFVFVMKKVFCYQPLVLYCDINHFQWDTKCMICLILNIFHSIFSAFFQEIHFRFFSVTKPFFPVHTDNFKLIKMIFENGVCKWESNTYNIQRVFGFLVQRS